MVLGAVVPHAWPVVGQLNVNPSALWQRSKGCCNKAAAAPPKELNIGKHVALACAVRSAGGTACHKPSWLKMKRFTSEENADVTWPLGASRKLCFVCASPAKPDSAKSNFFASQASAPMLSSACMHWRRRTKLFLKNGKLANCFALTRAWGSSRQPFSRRPGAAAGAARFQSISLQWSQPAPKHSHNIVAPMWRRKGSCRAQSAGANRKSEPQPVPSLSPRRLAPPGQLCRLDAHGQPTERTRWRELPGAAVWGSLGRGHLFGASWRGST